MFKHEVAGMCERITITHRGKSARVLVTLADTGVRPRYRVAVDRDPGLVVRDEGEWSFLVHGDDVAAFRFKYASNRDGALPTMVLDAERSWGVTWETLEPHPVLEAARARARKRLEGSAP